MPGKIANGGGANHPKYTKQKSENGLKKQSKKAVQSAAKSHLAPPVIINEDSQSNFASESCRDSCSSSDQVMSDVCEIYFQFPNLFDDITGQQQ